MRSAHASQSLGPDRGARLDGRVADRLLAGDTEEGIVMSQQSFVAGLLLGAGLVYLFDPRQGPRRRALIRDKGQHALHELEDATRIGARDLANRATGVEKELESALTAKPVDARKLHERVRAELGRVCSHPGVIEVAVRDSHVELRGPVLASELDEILRRVSSVRGVTHVDNMLEPHETADVPALQGEHRIPGRKLPPAALFVIGIASAATGIAALVRGSTIGFALGGLGAATAISRIEHRYERRRARARTLPRRVEQPATPGTPA